ncbi:MAG: succinate dehydrogenase cytochrome b subunit [Acidobacteriota bacterium]|nr:succinate dehydrogenase cytochrome b subunit [Acidobacteriota bacterium]
MTRAIEFYRSALGKKVLMAASGVLLFGFVLIHMLGNLKLYQGPEKLNAYAGWLRELGAPALPHEGALWLARIVLLAAVVVHADAAWKLTLANRRARPVSYKKAERAVASYASRTMLIGGVIVAAFVIYHLLHLTLGTVHPGFDREDVYRNVVSGFQVPLVSLFYVVANLLLGMHLYHGLWSMFQTLGLNDSGREGWRRWFAILFAALITLGNVSFPLAVLLGAVS